MTKLLDIIEAVPDIGDKHAREITIARMSFEAGKDSNTDTARLDWWMEKCPEISMVDEGLFCISWLIGEDLFCHEGKTIRDAIDSAMKVSP